MKTTIVLPLLWFGFVNQSDAGLGSWVGDQFHYLRTTFGEICRSPSINYNPEVLERNLRARVFGQPFIHNMILPLLKLHLSDSPGNRKALVLSFHGTPGSGKTYVAKIIAETIYDKGMASKFVHLYKPILHFAGQSDDMKVRLQEWIVGNVTQCKRQLFIFDEVNDLPEGVLEALKGFIDYSPQFGGLDFSQCIFIFLSNIAMVPINQHALDLWKGGVRQRELFEPGDFMKIIMEHAFNEDGVLCAAYRLLFDPLIPGGFKRCKLISSRLIDAFVPFLPLERNHVEGCIRDIAAEYSHVPIRHETIQTTQLLFLPTVLSLVDEKRRNISLGKPLRSQAREIVHNVAQFFIARKEEEQIKVNVRDVTVV